MTARGVSEAESAQEAGGVTGTSGQDAAEQADSRNTWKREKKLKFSYKEQREYETIEDDIANLEAKVEQPGCRHGGKRHELGEAWGTSGGKGSGRTGTGGKDGALGVPGGAWRRRLRGRNEEYNVSFYKAVFFFLFAAVR